MKSSIASSTYLGHGTIKSKVDFVVEVGQDENGKGRKTITTPNGKIETKDAPKAGADIPEDEAA